MIPEKSKIPIQLRFIPAGEFAFFAGGATMPELTGRACIVAGLADYTLTAGCTYVFK